MSLDTDDVVRELRAAGFQEAQADALSRLFKRVDPPDLSALATKVDVERIETKLDAKTDKLDSRIDTVRSQLETKIEAAKTETLKWVVGLVSLQTLVIVGTVVTLVRGYARP